MSPSSRDTERPPVSMRRLLSAWASVDLPLPDRPVKKTTSPCSSPSGRSSATTASMVSLSGPSPTGQCTVSPGAYAATT